MKLVQVADMGLFRTFGLLWSREREDHIKQFIKFAENLRRLSSDAKMVGGGRRRCGNPMECPMLAFSAGQVIADRKGASTAFLKIESY